MHVASAATLVPRYILSTCSCKSDVKLTHPPILTTHLCVSVFPDSRSSSIRVFSISSISLVTVASKLCQTQFVALHFYCCITSLRERIRNSIRLTNQIMFRDNLLWACPDIVHCGCKGTLMATGSI